jgi:hypothetical protein
MQISQKKKDNSILFPVKMQQKSSQVWINLIKGLLERASRTRGLPDLPENRGHDARERLTKR